VLPKKKKDKKQKLYRFEASLGKQFARPYLEKTHHKNRAGSVA
jgi:hypothetical protein